MTQHVKKVARDWGTIIVLAFLTAGILVLFALLIPALGRISDQAQAGEQAKRRQCVLYPVSHKVFRDARRRDVITARDLRRFRSSAPRSCARLQ